MDWKDHIVADAASAVSARAFVSFATESFLVTLANKGLYKRALKDLESAGRIELKAEAGGLQATLADATVSLCPNVAQSTCTCPSKTICKHILMGILAAAAYAESPTQEVASEQKEEPDEKPKEAPETEIEPWGELKKIDIASLRKQAGKKLFEDSLRLIQDGWSADLMEGDMLEATINTEHITVYFPRRDSLNGAVCKCGVAGLCKHKLIAILSYLSKQGSLSATTDQPVPFSLITEEVNMVLLSADRFIIGLLDKGLVSCGENEVEAAIQYALRMETSGIGNLSRLFRSLSSDLENMLGKHVGFNAVTTFATVSRLHNTMRLILENRQDNELLSQLIESTRSDYYTTPVGQFTALGACPWQTRSGYFGITAYFFYHEKQSVCTYTVALADYYEQTEKLADLDNLSRQYQKNEHWSGGVSLSALSHATFTLRNFKLNSQNRLSSSAQTQVDLTGKVNREMLQPLTSLFLTHDKEETGCEPYRYFQKKQPPRITLIPFHRLSEARFVQTEQKLYVSLSGENEEDFVEVTLPFNDLTKNAIRYLERAFRRGENKPRLMSCLKGPDGLTPVSIIGDAGVDDFYLIK